MLEHSSQHTSALIYSMLAGQKVYLFACILHITALVSAQAIPNLTITIDKTPASIASAAKPTPSSIHLSPGRSPGSSFDF